MSDNIKPSVTVVIPTFNDWRHTQECLAHLTNSQYPLDIILVDDGSTDGTSANVKQYFPQVLLFQGDGNLWWTGATNLGVQEAVQRGADYVLTLNNDVLIDPNSVSALVDCALEHPNSIVGSIIYYADSPKLIWCAGGTFHWPWPGEVMIGHNQIDQGQYDGVRDVEWTPGMGTLIPRTILVALNYYDNRNMPQYQADADFTLRARKLGYTVFVTSASKLYNHVENTGGLAKNKNRISWQEYYSLFTSFRSADYWRGRLTFMWRYCPRRWLLLAILIRYSRVALYGLKRKLT